MMRLDRLGLLAVPVLAGLLTGCQLVAGTGSRQLDPLVDANILPGLDGAASLGNGRIRIANLSVTPGNVDFCIKASSASSWGDPIMANAGGDPFFHAGLTYPQVTVPFSAPVGSIDVKFIPIGNLCTVTALSERDGITVGDAANANAPVVTILRYGGSSTGAGDQGIQEAVVDLPEELANGATPPPTCSSSQCPRFRVVNAASIAASIGFGQTTQKALPASVSAVDILSGSIPPGGVATAQAKGKAPLSAADTSGYFGGVALGSGQQLGLTLGIVECTGDLCTGNTKQAPANAVAIFEPSSIADTQTLYLIGDPANNIHPIEGLLVEDDQSAGGGPDGSVDWQFLAQSKLTTPASITVDSFDVELYGLLAPSEAARIAAITNAIKTAQSDVMCVSEIPFDSDKKAIASAALPKNGGNFGYSYYLASDVTMAPSSELTWYNTSPARITTAACAGSTDLLAQAADCVSSYCTAGGSSGVDAGAYADASVTSAACLEEHCTNQIVPLVAANPVCADCAILYLVSSYDVSTMYSECGSDSDDPYGQFEYGGMNGTLILSRYKFAQAKGGGDDTSAYLFPGSNSRRAAIRAKVQFDSNAAVDIYCAELATPGNASSVLSYIGPYATPDAGLYPGESTQPGAGWRDEQNLQARDLIGWVKSESGSSPAVLAGEWNAGLGATMGDGGTPVIAPLDPEVIQQLVKAGWVPAHPLGYAPACIECNSSPYQAQSRLTNDGTEGFDTTTTFLLNFPANSVLYETIWDVGGTEVPSIPGLDGGPFPLSPDYPRRVQVLRP